MQIYWRKGKPLHKKRVQLPKDWFGRPTWPPFHGFGTPIWPPWRHVKTLYWPRPHVPVFVWKRRFFFLRLIWPVVHTNPMKTVIGNVSFQKRSPEWRFWNAVFLHSSSRMKTKVYGNDTTRAQIPENVHAPIKDSTVFNEWVRSFRVDGPKSFKTATCGLEFFFFFFIKTENQL